MNDTIAFGKGGTAVGSALPSRFQISEFVWVWFGTALIFVVSAVVAPGTLKSSSLMAMLPFAGILAIVAMGQTVVIQQRGLDMSAAGMVSLSGIVLAYIGHADVPMLIAVPATLAIGALVGALNGLLVARANITPLVATLAMNALLIGVVRSLSGNVPITVPESLKAFSHSRILGLPYSVVLAALFVAILAIATKRTVFGRRFVAVGMNPRAASAGGILALRYQIGAYVISAICFTVAGMLLAGYIGSASHTAGNDYLLPGIAAVVVGGTPFTGGRGSVIASAIAALFMAQLGQMVLALGAGPAVQLLVQACAIILATTIRHIPFGWIRLGKPPGGVSGARLR